MNHAYLPDGRLVEWTLTHDGMVYSMHVDGQPVPGEFLDGWLAVQKRLRDAKARTERGRQENAREEAQRRLAEWAARNPTRNASTTSTTTTTIIGYTI